ncbi:uncharacterized protein LOC118477614 [Aplysia californica]|uniref:Uncharacterized protein LOC118477614 n=1 Tax=Aplysia californica TaxID=6500 RepID=A0ABM1VSP6_APLCA|nr:uncharacterized protein LOC118477614 [Aplysia californica]
MRAVDRHDQLLQPYNATRKTLKWHKKLGLRFLQIGLLNTHLIAKKAGNSQSFLDFQKDVIHKLLFSGAAAPDNGDDHSVPLTGRHFIDRVPATACKTKAQKKCRVCASRNIWKDIRQRQKAKAAATADSSVRVGRPPETRADTRKTEEWRAKNRLAQQKRRANMSSQKKRRERERNRAYLQRKKDAQFPKTPPAREPAPSTGVSASTVSRVKKRFGWKLLPSLKSLIKSLFKKNPEKLVQQGLSYSSPS